MFNVYIPFYHYMHIQLSYIGYNSGSVRLNISCMRAVRIRDKRGYFTHPLLGKASSCAVRLNTSPMLKSCTSYSRFNSDLQPHK